jgi:hypothetical protein
MLAETIEAAVAKLAEELAPDPMSSHAFGNVRIKASRTDTVGDAGQLTPSGRAGQISFAFDRRRIWMRIYAASEISVALDCGLTYAPEPLQGDIARLDEFMDRARDHVADYLAEVHLSSAAHVSQ